MKRATVQGRQWKSLVILAKVGKVDKTTDFLLLQASSIYRFHRTVAILSELISVEGNIYSGSIEFAGTSG